MTDEDMLYFSKNEILIDDNYARLITTVPIFRKKDNGKELSLNEEEKLIDDGNAEKQPFKIYSKMEILSKTGRSHKTG